jgi:hypothetical protein
MQAVNSLSLVLPCLIFLLPFKSSLSSQNPALKMMRQAALLLSLAGCAQGHGAVTFP